MRLILGVFLILSLSACKKEPVACIEVDNTSISVGTPVTFTSCSENALSFEWYMDGPTGAPENSQGWSDPQIIHSFTVPGTYTVTLNAYDDFSFLGEVSTAKITMNIN